MMTNLLILIFQQLLYILRQVDNGAYVGQAVRVDSSG